MSGLEVVYLMTAAAFAGTINAVAGGGTMLTFPVLLACHTSPIVANATSTFALVVGNSASIYGFRQQMAAVKPWFLKFMPVSLLGGLIGSILLTHTSESTFSRMVPFLIGFATLLFLGQPFFRRFADSQSHHSKSHGQHAAKFAVLFQFLVSIYGGYFGAGIGILMLASLGFLGFTDIHEMNALKNILGSIINLVAGTYFVAVGLVDWPKAGVMIIGALAGYYVGSHYSQRMSQSFIRRTIVAVGVLISCRLFWLQFYHGG
jgi:uncharacterized membrane protein YfcA